MKSHQRLIIVILLALTLTTTAFYQVFLKKQIPLNGNQLVAGYSPFVLEKWPDYPTGVPFKPGILDQLRIYYPYLRLTHDQWRNFQLPLWNPYNFTGNPHMAEWQSGAFYPFHAVSFFLSLQNHWIFMILSPFVLSFIFTYFYLKNLKLNHKSALFGALSFTFCGFMITWGQEVMSAPHSIMWLPLLLLSLDKFIAKKNKKWWLAGTLSITLSTLSGYWQTTLYLLCLAALYAGAKIFFFKSKSPPKIQTLLFTTSIFLVGLLLAAPQIIPTLELFNLSAKKTVEFSKTLTAYLLPWYQLITFFAPDFFGHPVTRNQFGFQAGSYYERILFFGVIPLFFTLFALINLLDKKRRREILFFFLSGVLFLIPTFNNLLSKAIFNLKVPLLSTVIANRTMFINVFCFSVLSAFGIEFWLKNPKRSNLAKKIIACFSIFAIIYGLILLVTFQAYRGKLLISQFPPNWYNIFLRSANPGAVFLIPLDWHIVSLRNLAIPGAVFLISSVFIFLRIIMRKNFLFWSIFILAFLHQFYFLQKFTPFSPREFVYPKHETIEFLQKKAGFNRFLGNNGLFLENNFATLYKIYQPTGYDSLNSARYSELLYAAGSEGKITKQRPSRSDAILPRDFNNPLLQRIAAILSIRYLIDNPKLPHRKVQIIDWKEVNKSLDELLKNRVELVFDKDSWRIYEYKDALPRAFLVDDFIIENNPQKIVDLLLSLDFNPKKTIILEKQPTILPQKTDQKGTAEITVYQPNLVRIKTNSPSSKLLYLSDSFFPGWQARVDGTKTKIYRANYAFRSIVVPEGKHEIVFSYFPRSLKIGFLVSLGGAVLALLIFKKLNF